MLLVINFHEKNLYTIVSYIITMATTIQISEELLKTLKKRKMNDKESYENIIWDLLEDTMELSEETKREMEISRQQIREGKVHNWEDIKKELKLNV